MEKALEKGDSNQMVSLRTNHKPLSLCSLRLGERPLTRLPARPSAPGFLLHDSHLFDAMDERQIANAIEVGARLSQQHGFQYIIMMNSDRIPDRDFSAGFVFDRHVIQPHLTVETETGGLYGFRFLQ